jgi:hypothetical protein
MKIATMAVGKMTIPVSTSTEIATMTTTTVEITITSVETEFVPGIGGDGAISLLLYLGSISESSLSASSKLT